MSWRRATHRPEEKGKRIPRYHQQIRGMKKGDPLWQKGVRTVEVFWKPLHLREHSKKKEGEKRKNRRKKYFKVLIQFKTKTNDRLPGHRIKWGNRTSP